MARTPCPALRFEDLPLFATDEEIAEACVGTDPEDMRQWVTRTPALEAHGFPKKIRSYGRRYTLAVRWFYGQDLMPKVGPCGARREPAVGTTVDQCAGPKLGVLWPLNRLALLFQEHDKRERAGRQSWRQPSEVLARPPHLRAERLRQQRAA